MCLVTAHTPTGSLLGWVLGGHLRVTASTTLNGGAARIVRRVAVLALRVLRYTVLCKCEPILVTRLTRDRFFGRRLTVDLVTGVALVVPPEHSANKFLLVAALTQGDGLDRLGVRQVALAATCDGRQLRFAVALLMVLVASETGLYRQRRVVVQTVAVATINLGVGIDRFVLPLHFFVAAQAIDLIGCVASAKRMTLDTLHFLAMKSYVPLPVTAKATLTWRNLEL